MRLHNVMSGSEFKPRFLCEVGSEGAAGTGDGGGGTTPASTPATGSDSAVSSPGASAAPTSSASGASDSSSPSALPSGLPQTGTPTPGESAPDAFSFDDFFNPTEPQVAAQVPAAQPATPQPTQQPTAGAEPAQPGTAQPAASPAPAAPAPAGQSPAPIPMDPESLGRALIQHEADAIKHLAQSRFQLTQEEIQALETDVVSALPHLMAKVTVVAQQNAFATLAKLVPAMLERHSASTRANAEAEDQFFSLNPSLNKAAHGATVKRFAAAYRAANPSAPREQMMQDVGMMVAMHHKIQPGTQPASNGAAGSPMAPVGVPKGAQPSPWTPAGAVPAGGATGDEGNPWDILARSE